MNNRFLKFRDEYQNVEASFLSEKRLKLANYNKFQNSCAQAWHIIVKVFRRIEENGIDA